MALCFAFFLALAAAKRETELVSAVNKSEKVAGRGYYPSHLWQVALLGSLAAGAAMAVLAAYGFSPSAANFYERPMLFSLVSLPAGIWLARILFLGWRGRMDHDPVAFAIKDIWTFLAVGAAVLIAVAAGIVVAPT